MSVELVDVMRLWFCSDVYIYIYPMIQALVTLKQKVRKYNKEFETEIQSFRENPVNSEDERAELGM